VERHEPGDTSNNKKPIACKVPEDPSCTKTGVRLFLCNCGEPRHPTAAVGTVLFAIATTNDQFESQSQAAAGPLLALEAKACNAETM